MTKKRMYTLITHQFGEDGLFDIFSTDDKKLLIRRWGIGMTDNIQFKETEEQSPYQFFLFINGYFALSTNQEPDISLTDVEQHSPSEIDAYMVEAQELYDIAEVFAKDKAAGRKVYQEQFRELAAKHGGLPGY